MSATPLKFPLGQKWQAIQGFAPLIPIVTSGKVFLRTRVGTAILSEMSGAVMQTLDGDYPAAAGKDGLFVANEAGLWLQGTETGVRRRVSDTAGGFVFIPVESCLYVQGIDLRCVDVARREVRWRHPWPTQYPAFGCSATGTASEMVYGADNGDVVCLNAVDGCERWRHSVSDLEWFSKYDKKCFPTGSLAIYKDRVLVQVRGRFVVGLDLVVGRRVWIRESKGFVDAALAGDRYYVVGSPYWILDPDNGKSIFEGELSRPKELPGKAGGINGPAALSESHVYCATHFGPIAVWERETGALAGIVKGKGARGGATIARQMLIKNGRLYYADASLSVFCFEEITPTDPVLKKQRAEAKAAGLGEGAIDAGVLDFPRAQSPPRAAQLATKASQPAVARRQPSSRKGSPRRPVRATAKKAAGGKAIRNAKRGAAGRRKGA